MILGRPCWKASTGSAFQKQRCNNGVCRLLGCSCYGKEWILSASAHESPIPQNQRGTNQFDDRLSTVINCSATRNHPKIILKRTIPSPVTGMLCMTLAPKLAQSFGETSIFIPPPLDISEPNNNSWIIVDRLVVRLNLANHIFVRHVTLHSLAWVVSCRSELQSFHFQ